jgi:hypothetical protein
MHKRSSFRNKIQKKLQDSGWFPFDIYNGRRDPMAIRRLPAIFLINLDESVERFCEAPVILRKTYKLGVEILVSHTHSPLGASWAIDEQLDQITEAIEKCLLSDDGVFLGEDLYWFYLESTEFHSYSKGDEILGHARMIFKIIYDESPDPSKPLFELETMELKYAI